MQVTEIKKIGKGKRYYLVLDEYNKFTIEAEILAKHKIKTFDEIDSEKLNQILLENDLHKKPSAFLHLHFFNVGCVYVFAIKKDGGDAVFLF